MENSRNELFEMIYQDHHPMVLQMCLGFVKGDKDTANDILQEIFISVWKNLDRFRGRSSYKTWIYRITVNACLQYVKKDKKQKDLIFLNIKNHPVNAETDNIINDNISDLYKAIGQLKKVDRLIIMMVLENQGYDEISKVLGIKPTNVRVKIHRIKKRLGLILKIDKND